MKSKNIETLSPKTKDAMSALASNLLVLAAYFKQYEPLLFESFEISKARMDHQKQRGLKKLKKLAKNALPPSFIEDFGNTIYQSRDLINFVSKSLKKDRIH